MKTLFNSLARAYVKRLFLSDNYPKGFGELFIEWMMDKNPGYVIYHIDRVRGSRRNIILEDSLAIYMNIEVNIEFLDESLSINRT